MLLEKKIPKVFIAAIVLSVAAGLFHLVGLFYNVNDAPMWRHGLFVVINFLCAFLFIKRPGFFVYLYTLFAVQQYYTHGKKLLEGFSEPKNIWLDFFVLLFVAIFLVNLMLEKRGKSAT